MKSKEQIIAVHVKFSLWLFLISHNTKHYQREINAFCLVLTFSYQFDITCALIKKSQFVWFWRHYSQLNGYQYQYQWVEKIRWGIIILEWLIIQRFQNDMKIQLSIRAWYCNWYLQTIYLSFIIQIFSIYKICMEYSWLFPVIFSFSPSPGFPQSAEGSRSGGSGRGQTGPGDPHPRYARPHGGWKCRSRSWIKGSRL